MYLANKTLLQGGRYKIDRHISSGGFGNTYEAIHTVMGSKVAIKEFFPKMFCNRDENTSHVTVATNGNRELVDKLRKKFNEEAKAVFQMNHPNIVRVLDIFEENGTAYYVMEYIDGKSLNEISKERGALPEAEAVGYIRQIADALKYVHSLNRLHLDIKPGNIMVDKTGKAILIDFGASKHYDDESGENTSTLMGVNTKGYAPIEQSTQSFTSFSPATDIYSLGATLYKMLTSNTPPDANLLMAEEEILKPLPGKVSDPTRKAVMSAMTLRRKGRPQSVGEFLQLLDSGNKDESPVGKAEDENTILDESSGRIVEANGDRSKMTSAPRKKSKSNNIGYLEKSNNVSVSLSSILSPKEKTNYKRKRVFIVISSIIAIVLLFIVGVIVSISNHNNGRYVENALFDYTNSSGEVIVFSYSGTIISGRPNNFGEADYPNGHYKGYYLNGKRQGDGTFVDKDGGSFEGVFSDNYYYEGKYTLEDGTYYQGTFNNQQPYNGTWYDKNGSEISEIINGVEEAEGSKRTSKSSTK